MSFIISGKILKYSRTIKSSSRWHWTQRINNLLDTQSRIVELLSLVKQQNSQTELLTKQQTKAQDKPELHPTEHAQPTKESLQQHQQNKHDQKPLYVDQNFLKQQYQSNQRLKKK